MEQREAETDDRWTATERDVPRRVRLVGGGLVASFAMAGLALAVAALPRGVARAAAEEEPIEVALVEVPEEAPPPEPEPAPARAPEAAPAAPGPRAPRIEAPVEMPKEAPPEKDPTGSTERSSAAPAEGPPGGGGTDPRGKATATAPPAAPPPPPPAAPAGPMRVTDDVEPPKPLSMGSPAYPAAARSAGIEGTVVVSYVVSESGAVTDARVVRGPPELAEACLAAVRAWRFSPAISGGRPVAVKRSARFPFRLRT